MGLEEIYGLLKESIYAILVFVGLLSFATFKGRQALMNLTLGLYLALLISIEFPYYDELLATAGGDPSAEAALKIIMFATFAFGGATLFARLMPDEFSEKAYESYGKKLILTLGATVLVLAFSYQVLPVTEFVSPGSPLQSLFAPESSFFFWLLAPLAILFLI